MGLSDSKGDNTYPLSQDDFSNAGFQFEENLLMKKKLEEYKESEESEKEGFEDEQILKALTNGRNKKYKLKESTTSCKFSEI